MENKDAFQNEDLMQDETIDATAGAAETAVTDDFKKEMLALQEQVSELKNKMLYQQAEFDNFRKRTMKEKAEVIAMASRDTLTALLPVLDDFDRASKNEQFTEGVNLVWLKLISTLKSKGLKEMETQALAGRAGPEAQPFGRHKRHAACVRPQPPQGGAASGPAEPVPQRPLSEKRAPCGALFYVLPNSAVM